MVITAGIRVAVGSTIRWIAFSGASREEERRGWRGSLMPFRARISPSFAVCSNYFRANGLYHSPALGVNKEPIFIMGFCPFTQVSVIVRKASKALDGLLHCSHSSHVHTFPYCAALEKPNFASPSDLNDAK